MGQGSQYNHQPSRSGSNQHPNTQNDGNVDDYRGYVADSILLSEVIPSYSNASFAQSGSEQQKQHWQAFSSEMQQKYRIDQDVQMEYTAAKHSLCFTQMSITQVGMAMDMYPRVDLGDYSSITPLGFADGAPPEVVNTKVESPEYVKNFSNELLRGIVDKINLRETISFSELCLSQLDFAEQISPFALSALLLSKLGLTGETYSDSRKNKSITIKGINLSTGNEATPVNLTGVAKMTVNNIIDSATRGGIGPRLDIRSTMMNEMPQELSSDAKAYQFSKLLDSAKEFEEWGARPGEKKPLAVEILEKTVNLSCQSCHIRFSRELFVNGLGDLGKYYSELATRASQGKRTPADITKAEEQLKISKLLKGLSEISAIILGKYSLDIGSEGPPPPASVKGYVPQTPKFTFASLPPADSLEELILESSANSESPNQAPNPSSKEHETLRKLALEVYRHDLCGDIPQAAGNTIGMGAVVYLTQLPGLIYSMGPRILPYIKFGQIMPSPFKVLRDNAQFPTPSFYAPRARRAGQSAPDGDLLQEYKSEEMVAFYILGQGTVKALSKSIDEILKPLKAIHESSLDRDIGSESQARTVGPMSSPSPDQFVALYSKLWESGIEGLDRGSKSGVGLIFSPPESKLNADEMSRECSTRFATRLQDLGVLTTENGTEQQQNSALLEPFVSRISKVSQEMFRNESVPDAAHEMGNLKDATSITAPPTVWVR